MLGVGPGTPAHPKGSLPSFWEHHPALLWQFPCPTLSRAIFSFSSFPSCAQGSWSTQAAVSALSQTPQFLFILQLLQLQAGRAPRGSQVLVPPWPPLWAGLPGAALPLPKSGRKRNSKCCAYTKSSTSSFPFKHGSCSSLWGRRRLHQPGTKHLAHQSGFLQPGQIITGSSSLPSSVPSRTPTHPGSSPALCSLHAPSSSWALTPCPWLILFR